MEPTNKIINLSEERTRNKRRFLLASKLMGEQCAQLPEGERPTWGHYIQLAESLLRMEERSKEQPSDGGDEIRVF
jgi:hypothetical protein